jgi:hypothetical protein
VLPLPAFLAGVLVFTRLVRRWRVLAYAGHFALIALVALLVMRSYGTYSLADERIASPGPWLVPAIAGEWAGLFALVISIRVPDLLRSSKGSTTGGSTTGMM